MKIIVSIAIIGLTVLITGCAAPQVPMSAADQDQIKHGKLVKFTTIDQDTSDKMRKDGIVFVCAVSTNEPTDATPCYPKMSAYIGKYFAAAGVPVSASRESANTVVYVTLGYWYLGAAVPYWSSGDSYRALFDKTIEASIEKNGVPELSKEAMDTIFKQDEAAQKDMARQSALETAGKIAIGLASVAIGGVNGGLYASQALTGIANPESITAPHGTTGPKQMFVFLHELGTNGKDGPVLKFMGRYDGPLDIFQAFDILFPSAVKKTAVLFAKNSSTLNADN